MKAETKYFWVLLLLTILSAQACARQRIVPDRTSPSPQRRIKPHGVYHIVEKHQTLYRICRTYGVELKEVASINGISDKSRIQVGQRIFIPGAKQVLKVDIVIDDVVVEPDDDEIKKEASKKPKLMWPVQGKGVDFFEGGEGRRHQGIDIACPLGTPIQAAGAGKVIYSGNAVRGYGNLIILRHSEEYVTVYAHNQKNLVEEGIWVERGQIIGNVGRTGNASGSHLHFEIRRNNIAVDPLDFLR